MNYASNETRKGTSRCDVLDGGYDSWTRAQDAANDDAKDRPESAENTESLVVELLTQQINPRCRASVLLVEIDHRL